MELLIRTLLRALIEGLSILIQVLCAYPGLVLVAAGVYLLLPRGGTRRPWTVTVGGAMLVTLALALLTQWPSTPEPALAGVRNSLFWPLADKWNCTSFHVFGAISLVAAILMVTSRNPVYSALWFALVLLANSGLFFLQGAEFLAASTIIVYAGAIIVTFLFVIMLAQPEGVAKYDRLAREPMLATLTGLLLSISLVGTIHHTWRNAEGLSPRHGGLPDSTTIKSAAQQGSPTSRINLERPHTAELGRTLFRDHFVSIEVVGMLLLVAVVGALLIASHRTGDASSGGSS